MVAVNSVYKLQFFTFSYVELQSVVCCEQQIAWINCVLTSRRDVWITGNFYKTGIYAGWTSKTADMSVFYSIPATDSDNTQVTGT